MFVSNHPSLEAPQGPGGAVGECGCQPTASVYLGGAWEGRWYDWLCCFSNYHTEHHDFPDVPAFELRKLRDLAPSFYADEVRTRNRREGEERDRPPSRVVCISPERGRSALSL